MVYRNSYYLIFSGLILLMISGCNNNSRSFEVIEFENPYEFKAEIESRVNGDATSFDYQMIAQSYASKTEYQNALKYWDLAMGVKEVKITDQQIDSIRALYKTENAIAYILQKAKSNQVIIINEAHHNSQHRVFAKSLLRGLWEVGYKNIGFETLGNGEYLDSMLMERKYPIQKTGYYTKDPQFGDLVRTALEIGFYVFPYEQTTGSNGKPREVEQARNIQKEIEKRPLEKFLIYSGFNHAFEGIHETWEKAMAARLTEYTDINPLTIDQITLSEKSRPKFNHPILSSINSDEPSILIDKNGDPKSTERKQRWTDLSVLHPNTKIVNGRPNWIFNNGNKSIPVDLSHIDISFPVMVLAYKEGEDINHAVPIDIVEIKEKSDKANLALRAGKYEIVLVNNKNDARKLSMNVNR